MCQDVSLNAEAYNVLKQSLKTIQSVQQSVPFEVRVSVDFPISFQCYGYGIGDDCETACATDGNSYDTGAGQIMIDPHVQLQVHGQHIRIGAPGLRGHMSMNFILYLVAVAEVHILALTNSNCFHTQVFEGRRKRTDLPRLKEPTDDEKEENRTRRKKEKEQEIQGGEIELKSSKCVRNEEEDEDTFNERKKKFNERKKKQKDRLDKERVEGGIDPEMLWGLGTDFRVVIPEPPKPDPTDQKQLQKIERYAQQRHRNDSERAARVTWAEVNAVAEEIRFGSSEASSQADAEQLLKVDIQLEELKRSLIQIVVPTLEAHVE